MYKQLKLYIVNFSSDDAKRTNYEPSIALESGNLKTNNVTLEPNSRALEV
jgi:hypothetical protein